MLFATRYRFKGDQSRESVQAMLAVFGERGPADGEIAEYVAADGRGGLVITDSDSALQAYENSLHYQEWMDIETTPVLTLEDALPTIMSV